MGVDFGQTKEFFHVTFKIPDLCPKNERVSEPRKNGRRFLTDSEIFSRDTEDT